MTARFKTGRLRVTVRLRCLGRGVRHLHSNLHRINRLRDTELRECCASCAIHSDELPPLGLALHCKATFVSAVSFHPDRLTEYAVRRDVPDFQANPLGAVEVGRDSEHAARK